MSTQLNPEAKFIHDIGSPLGTMVIVVATLIDELRERGPEMKEQVEQLETVSQLLEKVSACIAARRQELISGNQVR